LRARANAFLTFESKGEFRKAFELVAEDSKDYYFGATKEKSASFTIDEIQYGAGLSTATVKSTINRPAMLAGQVVDVPQLVISQWELEKGEWVWYHDPSQDVAKTIFGGVPAGPVEATSGSPLPKDLSQRAAAAAAAARGGPQAAIDKKVVTFTLGNAATEEVIFHNSNPGFVQVEVEVRGVADTVTVEPSSSLLDPQANLHVKLTYKPLKVSSMRGVVRFTLQPFGTVYALPVSIAPAAPPAPAVP